MTTPESAEAIRPYLNPEYWGGHTLGYGAMEEPPPKPVETPSIIRALSQARNKIVEQLGMTEHIERWRTYRAGEVFDVEDHEPGTIVIYRREFLEGSADELPDDVEALRAQQLPTRPMDITTNLRRPTPPVSIGHDSIFYLSVLRWGIVSPERGSGKILRTLSVSRFIRQSDGKIVISSPAYPQQTPIEIGATRHFSSRGNDNEKLERINILDIVAYGETEREEKKTKVFLPKPAFGGGTA